MFAKGFWWSSTDIIYNHTDRPSHFYDVCQQKLIVGAPYSLDDALHREHSFDRWRESMTVE